MARVGRFIVINSDIAGTNQCINDEILLPQAAFGQVVRNAEGTLLARVTNVETGAWRICCIGGPHMEGSMHCIIPEWLAENLGAVSFESWIEVEMLGAEEQPVAASKIIFRPMDNAAFYGDIRESFEDGLDMWHVIQEGSLIEVGIRGLGGYKIKALVEKVEPDAIGRLGGEVAVEFLKPDENTNEDDTDIALNDAIAASMATAAVAQAQQATAAVAQAQQAQQAQQAPLSAQERRDLVRQAWARKNI